MVEAGADAALLPDGEETNASSMASGGFAAGPTLRGILVVALHPRGVEPPPPTLCPRPFRKADEEAGDGSSSSHSATPSAKGLDSWNGELSKCLLAPSLLDDKPGPLI